MKKIVLILAVILLVLSGITAHAGKLTDNGDGTVTDSTTQLMWQQAEPGVKKWKDAMAFCDGLSLAGYDDWRLPQLEDLKSLIDPNLAQPAIDIKYFPDFPHTLLFFWTSTEAKDHPKYKAYVVIFNTGTQDVMSKKGKRYTKCVRSAQ